MIHIVLGNARNKLASFAGDRCGNIAIVTATCLPFLLGLASLGTEVGLWYYKLDTMQSAADSAAISAATAYGMSASANLTLQADGVTATYGFTDGLNQTKVTVNRSPKTGAYKQKINAVEVIIVQPQKRLLSALWGTGDVSITARAVAIPNALGCVLALDPAAAGSASIQGSVNMNLIGCALYDNSTHATALQVSGAAALSALTVGVVGGVSGSSSITTQQQNGLQTGHAVVDDPYAFASFGSVSGCNKTNYSTHSTETLNPGVYCGGMNLGSGAIVTLNPGVYYLTNNGGTAGDLTMNGQASISGTGVTLVFTGSGSTYGAANIAGGATINLKAPTTGATAGIAIFGDRNMPTNKLFKFTGGAAQVVGGAIYLPKAAVQWSGGAGTSTNCTQLIGNTLSFVGTTNLAVNCGGYGTTAIGSAAASLLE